MAEEHSINSTTDRALYLSDGTVVELTPEDVELLQLSFGSECEACGFDPIDTSW